MKKIRYDDSLLEDYYESGLEILVEDTRVDESNLSDFSQMVREDSCYMKDFMENAEGEVCGVHYIKVTDY